MKVRELIKELKKVPEEYLDYQISSLGDVTIINDEGKTVHRILTSAGYHDVDEFYQDAPEDQQTAPEKPPKYFNDADVFFDKFLRRVG
jgi:phenolic acid decarboxylase